MNIEQRVREYTPPAAAIEIIRRSEIALLVGISGAGKDTIKKALLRRDGFNEIISHTTRQPRHNEGVLERDNVDYHFIDEETALGMINRGEFIEVKFVHGTVYGTSVAEVQRAACRGVAITDIDVQGVSEYKEISRNVIAIFIVPPSFDEWIGRLRRRYGSEEEFAREWPRRRESAIRELTSALALPYYHCVINDDISRAVDVAADIATRPDRFTRKDDEARLAARDLLQQIQM